MTQNSQTTLKKKNKVGRLTLPDFKTHQETTVIKAEWHWNIGIQIENRIESSEIEAHIHGQLVFDKDAKVIGQRKKIFSVNGAGEVIKQGRDRMGTRICTCPAPDPKFQILSNKKENQRRGYRKVKVEIRPCRLPCPSPKGMEASITAGTKTEGWKKKLSRKVERCPGCQLQERTPDLTICKSTVTMAPWARGV